MKKYILPIATAVLLIVGCNKDFLNVSDELAAELSEEEIFNNATMEKKFHRAIFAAIPDYSAMRGDANTGRANPWAGFSDELKISQWALKNLTSSGYNASNAYYHRWALMYQKIRQGNIFMAKAKVIPEQGTADYVSAEDYKQMMAQAKFMRAYYHYLLFEQYGPIPIMSTIADPSAKSWEFPRNSVDEVVNWIDGELKALIDDPNSGLTDFNLSGKTIVDSEQNEALLPTKGVALAVRAKLWVYAASPLFNGGYTEALSLTNPDGKRLFPAYDATKKQKALAAVRDFINYSQGKYELYEEKKNDGTVDPDKSLYNLFQTYNKEIVWATYFNDWGNIGGEGVDRRCTPRTEKVGFACIAVTQELVDAFFMNDGKTIQDSPLYSETGMSVAGDDTTGRTEVGTFRMWINREPRFYQTVFYHGRRWHVSNNKVSFFPGEGNDKTKADYPWSGYLLYKRINRTVYNAGNHPRSKFRPSIIFRLADFYLLYAEMLNEVDPSSSDILTYVNKVRKRAGIPNLEVSYPSIVGNQEQQREAIRRERRVELATEGQRYFDVRRWMIADNAAPGQGAQGGPFYGMNMQTDNKAEFFQRTAYETRLFKRAMYLYPIPFDELQKNKGVLVQNPGW